MEVLTVTNSWKQTHIKGNHRKLINFEIVNCTRIKTYKIGIPVSWVE